MEFYLFLIIKKNFVGFPNLAIFSLSIFLQIASIAIFHPVYGGTRTHDLLIVSRPNHKTRLLAFLIIFHSFKIFWCWTAVL